eukprot:5459502-Amphidinium_carterae.1
MTMWRAQKHIPRHRTERYATLSAEYPLKHSNITSGIWLFAQMQHCVHVPCVCVLPKADMNAHCLCVICDFQGDMKQYIVLQTSIVDDAEEVLPADGTTHSFNEEGKERVYHVLMHEIAHLLHRIVEHRLQGHPVGEHTVFSPDRSDAKGSLTNDSGYLLEEQLLN